MHTLPGEHPRGDSLQFLFLLLFLALWIADSFFLHLTTATFSHTIPLPTRLFVFAVAVGTGVVLAASGHTAVRHAHGPTRVLTTGAFRYVRHPLYLAMVLLYFGLAFATGSLASFGLWIVIFLFYDYIAAYEERYMVEQFGKRYTEYREKTGKWLPRMGRR